MIARASIVVVVVLAGCPSERPCHTDDQCEPGQACRLGGDIGVCVEHEGQGSEGEGEGGGFEGEGEGEGEGGGIAVDIAVGTGFGCFIDSHQRVQCFGANGSGELGRATDFEIGNGSVPIAGLSSVELLTVGEHHACAVGQVAAGRRLVCWGDNTSANLGQNIPTNPGDLIVPNLDPNIVDDITAVAADGDNNGGITCANGDGETWCFGGDMPGYDIQNARPVRVTALDAAQTALFVSLHGICGVVGSDVVCVNTDAVLGNIGCTEGNACAPFSGGRFSIVDQNVCTASAGEVSCAGDNSAGVVDPTSPAAGTLTLAPVTQGTRVSIGIDHACALAVDNTVVCWGRSFEFADGRSGSDPLLTDCNDGVGDLCQTPLQVPMPPGLTVFSDVVTRDTGACALEATGRIVCWGDILTLNQTGEAAVEVSLAP